MLGSGEKGQRNTAQGEHTLLSVMDLGLLLSAVSF